LGRRGRRRRITLTYLALDSSRELAFLVAGAEKKDILRRVQVGDRALPAARIRPIGRLHWFTDRAAASA
jgi:6-phosphogluconolactonase